MKVFGQHWQQIYLQFLNLYFLCIHRVRRLTKLSLQECRGRRCSSKHSGGLHVLPIQRFVCRNFTGRVLPDRTQRHQQEVGLTAVSLHLSQLVGRGLHVWVFLIHRFYSRDVRASGILNGDVEPPHECSDLYHILEEYTEAYTADWTSKNMRAKVTEDIMEINSCDPGDNWCSVLFCPSSLLVLHPDLQLLLSREHQPATSHQQRTVTVMPF